MLAHVQAIFLVVAANVIIFVAAGQVRGGIAPVALSGYYDATSLAHRLIIAGFTYALIIGPFTLAFALRPATASFAQAIMGALMVLGLAVAAGGKLLSVQMVIATVATSVAAIYLAWAVSAAPDRSIATDAARAQTQQQ
jgi:hypothetical protein